MMLPKSSDLALKFSHEQWKDAIPRTVHLNLISTGADFWVRRKMKNSISLPFPLQNYFTRPYDIAHDSLETKNGRGKERDRLINAINELVIR